MKKLLLIQLCLACMLILKAQTDDMKWNIGVYGGITQYKGGLGNDFYKSDETMYGLAGLSVSRYLGKHFDVSLLGTKGTIGYTSSLGSIKKEFSSALLNLKFNILGPQYMIRPYLMAGGGLILFDKYFEIKHGNVDLIAPSLGGGINIRFGPVVSLNLQETFLMSNNDRRDGVVSSTNVDYLFHTVGLTFNLGKKKDTDGDGVSDRNDKCPNTPKGIAVDKFGCPLDRDKDGVADYLDSCPEMAGTAALHGCPDRDGDGIADKDDRCPDKAGSVAMHGCPDSDGDGIADVDDRCPNAAGTLSLHGCPDSDKDGVADIDDKCPGTKAGYVVDVNGCPLDNDKDGIVNEEDRCPDAAGPESLHGCPDSDGDGVADIVDRCPNVKGTIANKGCPEMAKQDIKRITEIASKLFFETNKDVLKVASLVQLDELATILQRYENANLIIEGHTDTQGKPDYNMTLSQKRTEAVKKYLISKGIVESRLSATGYGETRPIADNKTVLGRAKNRRVELKTSY